jgi:hypothetical protein
MHSTHGNHHKLLVGMRVATYVIHVARIMLLRMTVHTKLTQQQQITSHAHTCLMLPSMHPTASTCAAHYLRVPQLEAVKSGPADGQPVVVPWASP